MSGWAPGRFQRCAATALALLLAWAGVNPSRVAADNIQKVFKLRRECLAGKQKACSELAKIAVEDKDARIRSAAVAEVFDQAVLAKVAIDDSDEKVRNAAFGRLTDQTQLERVAAEAKYEDIRTAAQQALLARAAVNAHDATVRAAAVEKLTDQLLLANISERDKEESVRKTAVSALARMSLEISTVSAEREVYIWRAAPGGTVTPPTRWKIKGSLGKGAMGAAGPINPEIGLAGAVRNPGPAPGFDPWYFSPRDSLDNLTLESGGALNFYGGALQGPITFIGLATDASGGTFWATPPNLVGGYVRFHTVLYPGPHGALMLGGMLFLYQGGMMATGVDAEPVSVTGTLRFPGDRWTWAKPGFAVKGGALQFDETGVFLMPGTEYLKSTAKADSR